MDAHADPAEAVAPRTLGFCFDDSDDPAVDREDQTARAHRQAVAEAERHSADTKVTVIPDAATATEAAAATLLAMKAGADEIANGLLGIRRWWGKPARLVKHNGSSNLGSWHYRTRDELRSRKQSIRRVAILNGFFAELLQELQGVRPPAFELNRRGFRARQEVALDPYRDDLRLVIDEVRDSLDEARDPMPDIRRDACEKCRWMRACERDARRSSSITLLTNSRRDTEQHFRSHGIETLDDLAKHPRGHEIMNTAPYLRRHSLKSVAQARAFVTGQAVLVGLTKLPQRATCEVFVDFETEGRDNRTDGTVFGVLIRRRKPRAKIHIAAGKADRRRAWTALLRSLDSAPHSAPIFHYGSFDRKLMEGMIRAFGGSRAILARLVDVQPEVVQRVAIPEPSGSLKAVARAIGAERRHELDGYDAIRLWSQYAATRKRDIRQQLREYNEDDLRCLMIVTDWLRAPAVSM